ASGGCSLLVPLDQYGSGGSSSGAGAAGAPSLNCPAGVTPAESVTIPTPAGGTMSIDRTEVTRCQYQAFLDATRGGADVGVEGLLECSWNDTYAPGSGCIGSEGVYVGQGAEDHPQPCVDWCDAYAYCIWAGKHLCGGIAGGPVGFAADYDDPSLSE